MPVVGSLEADLEWQSSFRTSLGICDDGAVGTTLGSGRSSSAGQLAQVEAFDSLSHSDENWYWSGVTKKTMELLDSISHLTSFFLAQGLDGW